MGAAVDILMQQLYEKYSLGDPGGVAFAAKVNTAAQRLQIFEEMKDEFISIGMSAEDASAVMADLRKATNHAAQMLQTLRRSMGDVYGSKPDPRRTAYDVIKYSAAICGLFESHS